MQRRRFIGLAIACLLLGSAWAYAQPGKDISLTIYSSADPQGFDPQQAVAQQRQQGYYYQEQYARQIPGFAVIRDLRELDLKQGLNAVAFTDVAQLIDATTVSLVDLSQPPQAADEARIKVIEQKFQFDLVSSQKLLEKYLDRPISVNLNLGNGKQETVSGLLLSNAQGQLVLKTDKGLRLLNSSGDVQLGELPEGLITKPTLEWQLWSPAAGKRMVRTAYQTDGITWRSDYNLVLNREDTAADLGAWVTILNMSGARYPNANLKLIAGDVQRIQPQRYRGPPSVAQAMNGMMEKAAAPAGFQEKSFFEYHMYTLPRRTTVDQNATQQIALFDTKRGVKVEKVMVYYGLPDEARWWFFPSPQTDRSLGQQSNKKVDVYIRFENRESNRLGIPLPKGKVRVFKADEPAAGDAVKPDGALEFVGEDLIDHTAKNEKVLIKIGRAFDVTGERTQTDFKVDSRRDWMEESFKIVLRNAKDRPQKVIIRETLYRWVNWEVIQKTAEFEKIDARTIHFEVEVPAAAADKSGEKTVEYTVRYTW